MTIAIISINFYGKLFHIVNKTVLQLCYVGQLWRVFLELQYCATYMVGLIHLVLICLLFYIRISV